VTQAELGEALATASQSNSRLRMETQEQQSRIDQFELSISHHMKTIDELSETRCSLLQQLTKASADIKFLNDALAIANMQIGEFSKCMDSVDNQLKGFHRFVHSQSSSNTQLSTQGDSSPFKDSLSMAYLLGNRGMKPASIIRSKTAWLTNEASDIRTTTSFGTEAPTPSGSGVHAFLPRSTTTASDLNMSSATTISAAGFVPCASIDADEVQVKVDELRSHMMSMRAELRKHRAELHILLAEKENVHANIDLCVRDVCDLISHCETQLEQPYSVTYSQTLAFSPEPIGDWTLKSDALSGKSAQSQFCSPVYTPQHMHNTDITNNILPMLQRAHKHMTSLKQDCAPPSHAEAFLRDRNLLDNRLSELERAILDTRVELVSVLTNPSDTFTDKRSVAFSPMRDALSTNIPAGTGEVEIGTCLVNEFDTESQMGRNGSLGDSAEAPASQRRAGENGMVLSPITPYTPVDNRLSTRPSKMHTRVELLVKDALDNLHTDMETVRRTYTQLDDNFTTIVSDMNAIYDDKQLLKLALQSAQSQASLSLAEIESLKADKGRLIADSLKATKQITSLLAQIEATNAENAVLVQQLEATRDKHVELTQAFSALDTAHSNSESRVRVLVNELHVSNQSCEDVRRNLEILKERLDIQEIEAERVRIDFENKCAALRSTKAEVDAQLASQALSHAELAAHAQELQADNDAWVDEVEDLERKVDLANAAAEEIRTQLTEAQARGEQLMEQREKLTEELEVSKRALKVLEEAQQAKSCIIATLQARSDGLSQVCTEAREQNNQLLEDIQTHLYANSKLQADIDAYVEELEELEKENEILHNDKRNIEHQMSDVQGKYDNLLNQLCDLLRASNGEEHINADSNDQHLIVERLKRMQVSLQGTAAQLQQLVVAHAGVVDSYSGLSCKHSELSEQHAEIHNELQVHIRDKVTASIILERLQHTNQVLEAQVQSLLHANSQQVTDFTNSHQLLECRISELEQVKLALELERSELHASNSGLSDNVNRLTHSAAVLTAELQLIKSEVSAKETMECELRRNIEQLCFQLKDAENVCFEQKQIIERLNKVLDVLEANAYVKNAEILEWMNLTHGLSTSLDTEIFSTEELKKELSGSRHQLENMLISLQESQTRFDGVLAKRDELIAVNSSQLAKIDELESSTKSLQAIQNDDHTTISSLRNSLAASASNEALLSEALEQVRRDHEFLCAANSHLVVEMSELKLGMTKLETTVSARDVCLAQLQDENAQYRATMDELSSTHGELHIKHLDSERQSAELLAEMETLKIKLSVNAQTIAALTGDKKVAAEILEKLHLQNESVSHEVHKLQSEKQDLYNENINVQSDLQESNRQVGVLLDRCNELTSAHAETGHQLQQLQSTHAAVVREYQQIQDEMARLQQELDDVKGPSESVIAENSMLLQKLGDLDKEIVRQVQQMQTSVESWTEKVQLLEGEKCQALCQLELLEQERSILQLDNERLLSDFSRLHQAEKEMLLAKANVDYRLDALTIDNAALASQLRESKSIASEKAKMHAYKLESLQCVITDLTAQLQQAAAQLGHAHIQGNSLQLEQDDVLDLSLNSEVVPTIVHELHASPRVRRESLSGPISQALHDLFSDAEHFNDELVQKVENLENERLTFASGYNSLLSDYMKLLNERQLLLVAMDGMVSMLLPVSSESDPDCADKPSIYAYKGTASLQSFLLAEAHKRINVEKDSDQLSVCGAGAQLESGVHMTPLGLVGRGIVDCVSEESLAAAARLWNTCLACRDRCKSTKQDLIIAAGSGTELEKLDKDMQLAVLRTTVAEQSQTISDFAVQVNVLVTKIGLLEQMKQFRLQTGTDSVKNLDRQLYSPSSNGVIAAVLDEDIDDPNEMAIQLLACKVEQAASHHELALARQEIHWLCKKLNISTNF
jgi:chromosome segregation ATPase